MGRDEGVQLHRNGAYWQARWYDSNGRRKTRSLGKRKDAGGDVSERAARRKCSAIATELALEPARRDAGGNATVGWWWERYIEQRTDLSPQSVVIHRDTIRYLRAFFDDARKLESLTRADATDWRVWMTRQPRRDAFKGEDPADVPRMSETTVCKHVRTAKTIINHAITEGHLAVNPFSHLQGKAPRKRQRDLPLTDDDIQRLVDAAPSPAWKATVGLCAWAGMRRNEVLRLTWGDIDWPRRRIIVMPEEAEGTKKGTRDVLLEKRLERLLLEVHEQAQTGTNAVAPIPVHNLHRNMVAIVKRAGFPVWRKPYHALRGWRVTTWRRKYPEHVVDAWLGHSLEVAREHYAFVPEHYYEDGPTDEDLRAQVAILRRRLRRVLAVAQNQKANGLAQNGAQKSPGDAGADS